MSQPVEIGASLEVTTSVLANVRQGSPSTTAPVAQKAPAGTAFSISAVAIGDSVQGNPRWYHILDSDLYIWAGACVSASLAAVSSSGSNHGQFAGIPLVVDMSHGDGLVSFAAAKQAGVAGIIHKATTGGTGRDDAYRDRRKMALDAGLLWGAYHWGTAADVDGQVANFLEWAAPDDQTLIALDYETTVGNQMTLDIARGFSDGLFAKLGRRPVIYSGDVIKTDLGSASDPFFGQHRLWLAQYGPKAVVQPSWNSYWLWQFTDGELGPATPSVPGLPGDSKGRLDCDYYPNSVDQLKQEWAK